MRSIIIDGKPQPKERPKVYNGHGITPTRTRQYEERVAALWRAKYRDAPTTDDLAVTIFFFMPIPTSWSKNKRARAALGKIRPGVKPDIDNLVKIILDGTQGTIFADDKQIVSLTACKRYAEEPRTEVYVERLPTEKE